MEFDSSKVYTALDADDLKVGSNVVVAEDLAHLRVFVHDNVTCILEKVLNEENAARFVAYKGEAYSLAYLVSEPEEKKLELTDLKVGDVVRHKESGVEYVITAIDKRNNCFFAYSWHRDSFLEECEKVEDN